MGTHRIDEWKPPFQLLTYFDVRGLTGLSFSGIDSLVARGLFPPPADLLGHWRWCPRAVRKAVVRLRRAGLLPDLSRGQDDSAPTTAGTEAHGA